MPGNIKSVTVYILTNAASKTTYHCAFSTTECTSAYTTGSTAVNITGGKSNKYTCTLSNAKYFCISLGNENNGQVYKLDVEYETAAPTTYTVTLNPNYPEGKTGVFKDKSNKTINGNLVLSYPSGTASMQITSLYNSLTLDGYDFGGWYNAMGINPGDVSGSPCTNTGNITGDKTYYAKWTQKAYTVTATSNNNNYGTVSVSGTTITASPKTGYTYANPAYTVTSGTAIVTQNGNTFTVTPSTNCTIRINFEAKPKYTVTLVPGSGSCLTTSLQETSAGAGVALPTANPPTTCDAEGWDFAGWAETIVTETTTAPTLLAASSNYKPTSDITLYAIYSKTETTQGGGTTSTDASLSFASTAQRTSFSSIQQVWEQNDITLTNTKGTDKNDAAVADYANPARFYANSKVIIEAPGNITQIVFDCNSDSYATAMKNSITGETSLSNDMVTLELDGTSDSYTITSISAQVRIDALTVTYTTSGGGSTTTTYYHSNPECGPQKLATPNVELTYDCSSATITWDAVSNAKAYWYQIIKTGDTNSGISSTNTTYTRNDIEPGVSYTWSVKTIGDGSKFSDSEIATGTFTAYSIRWLANGELIEKACGKAGEAIVVPSNNPASCDDAKEFVGWTATPIDGSTDTEPDDLFTTSPGNITGNATYHAVFATKSTGSGSGYKYIGDDKLLTIGKNYIFVSSKTSGAAFALKASDLPNTGQGTKGTAVAVLVETGAEGVWVKNENSDLEFEAVEIGEDYTLRIVSDKDKYLYINGSGVGCRDNSRAYYDQTGLYGWNNDGNKWYDVYYDNTTQKFIQKEEASSRVYAYEKSVSMSTTYSGYVTTCDATKATVTYDLNGGTGATCERQTVTKGEAFTLCNQTPTKVGYNFAGWTDGVNTYNAGASTSVTDNTKFYAAWIAKTIKITWNQNYTDCPESETSTYIYDGEDIEMPEDPIRTGYKFNGWYTKANDGTKVTEVGDENKPSADVTYYAQWKKLHTVTFIASGQVYVKQEHKYISGDKLVLPEIDPSAANFACDGYLFEGWSKYQQTKEDANCPELVDANTLVENDLELHAVWKKASTSGAGTQIFYESFDTENGTGGNDGKWSGDIAKNNKVNTTWTFENEGGAYQCIKLGSGSKKGSATTPALTQLSGDAILSFKAAAWNSNSESTILKLSISGGGTLTQTSVTLVKGAWTTYEVTITDGTPSSTITFAAANASNNRFFLDEVKITTSGSYNYTTSPSCGPTMVAKENVWATSAAGQSVKVNVPLGIKLFEGNATITGTSTNENFVVNTLENAGNGEHQVVVVYTPSADDTKENTTITLTAKNGEEIWCTTTFTLNGRSLPDEFVIVAQYNDKWLAVPANMQSGADQYNGIEVTPDNALTQIPAAPSTTIYSLRGVADNRYEEAGTCVRLVGNGNKCLWGNAASTNTTIQNWTTLGATNGSNYEWLLTTSDGELYTIANPAHPDYDEGRILSNSGSKYGLYKGTTKFYILPVGCSSLPGNIQVTARRVDATFSWEGNASSMQIDIYTNEGMTEGHISNTATASPYYMTGLSESTQYWFKMTPNGTDEACEYTGSFKTTGPTIDVVEWKENAAVIFVDKDEELNPLVIIDGEVEHGVGGTKATDIFFSKYFEAQSEAKLLAIYNGTANAISLADITILQRGTKHSSTYVPLSLAPYGKTPGRIQPGEELILYNEDQSAYSEDIMKCAESDPTFSNWVKVDNNNLAFSGKGTVRLFRGDKCIDIIGAMGSAEDIHDKEVTPLEGTEKPSFGDKEGFTTSTGDNYSTDDEEKDYTLSTNRCLLVRKPSVTSGAIAVTNNIGDFKTLGNDYDGIANEWAGLQVPNGPSDNKYKYTCEGFQEVGSFDYNNYYKEYNNIDDDTYLESYTHDDATKEYTIPIENLAKYSCLNIRFQLKKGDQVLTEEPVQVPIIVSDQKATNDAIFNAIVKTDASEPVYDQSIERCKTCNVVVLSDATLTKATDGTKNDVAEVANLKIYPGGQVVVPAETNYTVNSLAFRRQEDEVSMANIQGKLNVKHTNGVYLDVRIDPSNWHYMTLPYDCRVGDVTFADGTPAVVNTDYLLGWYDGAYRAEHKTGGWTYITDNDYILKKGLGYIVALPGDGKVRREMRFPMANDVIAEDLTGKTVSGLYAYGGDKTDAELRPNHKGWNMIGSPYLYTYTTDIVKEPLQMGTLEHSPVNPWDGTWVRTGDARYIVEPIDNGWSGYRQTTISNLKPFTSYFIQVGGVLENGEYTTITPETEQQIIFAANSVARNASAPRKAAEAEVADNHPVWYGVEMIAPNNEKDNTTLLISNEFTDGYDMMDDLVKMRGDYYQYYNFPVLASNNNEGEMAFNALPDSSAAKIGVPLSYYAATAGTYTIATDGRFDLEEVKAAMLYDATTTQYTNLLTENYSFTTNKGNNTNRFTLFVTVERKKVPNITTGMDNLLANGQLSLIAVERTLVLSGLTENADIYVYDMSGKMVTGTHSAGENGIWRTTVPATGVYFVRVNSANSQQTLRTIVK